MTAKQIAIRNVAKMVGLGVLIGALTSALLIHVPSPYLGIGVCVIIMLYVVHMFYEMELSKAQHLDELNKLNSKETK
jgi:uncharacterized membrane protein YfcA